MNADFSEAQAKSLIRWILIGVILAIPMTIAWGFAGTLTAVLLAITGKVVTFQLWPMPGFIAYIGGLLYGGVVFCTGTFILFILSFDPDKENSKNWGTEVWTVMNHLIAAFAWLPGSPFWKIIAMIALPVGIGYGVGQIARKKIDQQGESGKVGVWHFLAWLFS